MHCWLWNAGVRLCSAFLPTTLVRPAPPSGCVSNHSQLRDVDGPPTPQMLSTGQIKVPGQLVAEHVYWCSL